MCKGLQEGYRTVSHLVPAAIAGVTCSVRKVPLIQPSISPALQRTLTMQGASGSSGGSQGISGLALRSPDASPVKRRRASQNFASHVQGATRTYDGRGELACKNWINAQNTMSGVRSSVVNAQMRATIIVGNRPLSQSAKSNPVALTVIDIGGSVPCAVMLRHNMNNEADCLLDLRVSDVINACVWSVTCLVHPHVENSVFIRLRAMAYAGATVQFQRLLNTPS